MRFIPRQEVSSVRCKGKWMTVGIVVDAVNGMVLSIDEYGNEIIDGTNNDCERAIGWWIKERYRFDTGTHLSGIDPYVKNVCFCLYVLYPIASFAIQSQAMEDRKQRFVIQPGFHPQDASGNPVIAHFLDYDVHQVFTLPMS